MIKAVGQNPGGQRKQDPWQMPRGGDEADQKRILGQQGCQPRHRNSNQAVAKVGGSGGCKQQAKIAVLPQRGVNHPARLCGRGGKVKGYDAITGCGEKVVV